MPVCEHCGAHVSQQYVRVLCGDGVTDPPACPWCEDATLEDGERRMASSFAGVGREA